MVQLERNKVSIMFLITLYHFVCQRNLGADHIQMLCDVVCVSLMFSLVPQVLHYSMKVNKLAWYMFSDLYLFIYLLLLLFFKLHNLIAFMCACNRDVSQWSEKALSLVLGAENSFWCEIHLINLPYGLFSLAKEKQTN